MNLEDLMADDTTRILLNEADHASAFTFYPDAGATGGSVSLVIGLSTEVFLTQDRGTEDQRRVEAFGSLAALRAVISTVLGALNVREPRRGDSVFRETGAYAGTWYVGTVSTDNGDGCTLALSRDQIYADVGADVQPEP